MGFEFGISDLKMNVYRACLAVRGFHPLVLAIRVTVGVCDMFAGVFVSYFGYANLRF
jgi:hypothetical protein